MRYLVLHDKRPYGPFDSSEIRELVTAGVLLIDDLIAPEGTDKFKPIAKINLTEAAKPLSVTEHVAPLIPPIVIEETACATTVFVYNPEPIPEKSAFSSSPTARLVSKIPGIVNGLAKVLPEKWLQKNLCSRALTGFLNRLSLWLVLLGTTFFIQYFLFSGYFSKLFRLIFPGTEPTGISFTGQITEMVIVSVLCSYALITAIAMIIHGAQHLYCGKTISINGLFYAVQSRLSLFFLALTGLSLLLIPLYVATALLPPQLELWGKYIALMLFVPLAYRLLPFPWIVLLENFSLWRSLTFCSNLTYGQFKPIVRFGLINVVILTALDLLVRFNSRLIILKYIFLVYLLILATYAYLDLMKVRHYKS